MFVICWNDEECGRSWQVVTSMEAAKAFIENLYEEGITRSSIIVGEVR